MSSTPRQAQTQHPIYMTTWSAGTNIAVIKYWGKADESYNTPINSSVSCTLDQQDLRAVTTVAASYQFTKDRLWLNGVEDVRAAENSRFRACLDGVKALATDRLVEQEVTTKDDSTTTDDDSKQQSVLVTKQDWQRMHVHVSSYNTFPTAAGLASSAAGYAALVAALAHLVQAQETFPHQLTTIARQGSGSACRSMYGGCVAWRHGQAANQWQDSLAEPIADCHHWPKLRAVIAVVSDARKETSSTAGMRTSVATSTLLEHRATVVVPERLSQLEAAYVARDFETFGRLTMQDSNQFHAVCLDTYPPIFYLNDTSQAIIRLATAYNAYRKKICAAYTFDAGPNAVLYCLEEHAVEIGALLLQCFPPPSADNNNNNNNHHDGPAYVANSAEYASQIQAHPLSDELLKCLDQPKRPGQVKNLYYTRPGPGPQRVTDVCNLDPATGLNVYQPPTAVAPKN